jgi:hypothetical protein
MYGTLVTIVWMKQFVGTSVANAFHVADQCAKAERIAVKIAGVVLVE